MSDFSYRCHNCSASYAWNDLRFRCGCGGLFQLEMERTKFNAELIQDRVPSLLRYLEFLPRGLRNSLQHVTLGEGWTPTVPARLNDATSHLQIKMDHLTPTHSFKDRGAVMLVALAHAIKAKRIVQDSSGNAGHAIAVYAARAKIPCEIFLPASASQKSVSRIEATGATVQRVEGTREDTANAARVAAEDDSTFYASHVFNPLFYEGTKTYAYELFEQFSRLPRRMVLPLGNGTLVLGVLQAVRDLEAAGMLSDQPVEIVAVQAANCAPIAAAHSDGQASVSAVQNKGTMASGIAIADPARGSEILEKLAESPCDSQILVAREAEIQAAQTLLASRGLDVESTTAASFAVALNGALDPVETVIPVCGSGIKK